MLCSVTSLNIVRLTLKNDLVHMKMVQSRSCRPIRSAHKHDWNTRFVSALSVSPLRFLHFSSARVSVRHAEHSYLPPACFFECFSWTGRTVTSGHRSFSLPECRHTPMLDEGHTSPVPAISSFHFSALVLTPALAHTHTSTTSPWLTVYTHEFTVPTVTT